MQVFAAHVGRLPPADRERILGSVPENLWAEIAAASALTWLPFETNLVCTQAVARALGPERTHEFFQTLLLSTFRTPLLQSLVDAVVRKLGADPSTSLFWVARGFDLMFEGCGTWHVAARREHIASLQVMGLPFVVASDPVWIQSVASALSALFVVAGLRGEVTIRDTNPGTGTAVFDLSYS